MLEKLKVVYKDDKIVVSETGRDYDFIAIIENKTTKTIHITPDESDVDTMFEKFDLKPCDWIGILADEEGRNTLKAIKEGKFYQEFV